MEDLRPKTILFCAVLAFAIAFSVLLRGRRAVHWLFAAFAADIALWYASQSLAGFFRADLWERVTGLLTVLLPQLAIHLFQAVVPLEVPNPRPRLARFALVAGVPLLAVSVSPQHNSPYALGAVYTYFFGLLAMALVTLAQRGQRSRSRAVRDRVRFLVWVGAAATTFSLADFLSYLGVSLPPIGAVLAIVFVYVLAESVTRPRLADIYELSGRLLVSTALAFCLAGIFYMFVMVVGGFDTMYLNAVLAAIVFLVLFEPLQTEVERRIHQFFFRERYDLETSVGELRAKLAHVLEIDEMVSTLMEGLERSRRVTTAALYLLDSEGDGFDLSGSIGAAVPRRIESVSVKPLLDRLDRQPSLSLEEIAREPGPADAGVLAAAAGLGVLQSAVALAVRIEGEGSVALLFVADDRVRDAFIPEEIALLDTIAAQIAVVVTNSRVYSRMKERDRLAALGSMAAGLAHEVKNPLGAIKGAAQLLEEVGPSAPDEAREFVGIILEEVNRLDRVVGSFLDYARPHAGNPIPLDVNAAVRRTVQIVSSQITDGAVDVQLELKEPLPRTRMDPEKLRQVLMNLLQNAIQAMDGRGKITVTTSARRATRGWNTTADGSMPSRRSLTEDLEVVEVSVSDTGPGISPKVLRNLFIPFFTTKSQGTGLGLAISQSIVRSAGGTIEVQSQPGAGTRFTIALPCATDAIATPDPPGAQAGVRPSSKPEAKAEAKSPGVGPPRSSSSA